MEEKENNVVYVDFNSKEKVIPIHDSNFLTTITLKIKKLFKHKSSNKCNKNSNKKRYYNNVP